jgi:hypothetical protein
MSTDTTHRLGRVLVATLRAVPHVLSVAATQEHDLLADIDAMAANDDPHPSDPQPTPLEGYFSIGHQAVFAGVIIERYTNRLIVERRGPDLLGAVAAMIADFEAITCFSPLRSGWLSTCWAAYAGPV